MKRGNFMKKQRKFYFILMVLFAMMFGLNSMAAPFPATIKNNVVYNVTARYYENHYHKFTVLQDGYITVYGYSKTKGSNKKYNLSIQLRKSEKRALYDYYTVVLSLIQDVRKMLSFPFLFLLKLLPLHIRLVLIHGVVGTFEDIGKY